MEKGNVNNLGRKFRDRLRLDLKVSNKIFSERHCSYPFSPSLPATLQQLT